MANPELYALNASQTRRNAAIDALRAPCYALGITMAGFSTIAREAGFDFWMTLMTSLGVWGMPGQVAFASLYSAGASLFIIFVAVSLANMRMLLMVISAADMMHLKSHNLPLWKRIFWMQFLAITAWANLGLAQQKYPSHLLLPYYQGFALTIFVFGGAIVDLALFYGRNNLLINGDQGWVPGNVFGEVIDGLEEMAAACQDLWLGGVRGETLSFQRA